MKALASLFGVVGNRAVSRYENIGGGRFHCIQCFQPTHAVTVVDVEKLVGKIKLAQIGNPVLRYEDDTVAARVPLAQVKDLDFFSAEVKHQPIRKSNLR